MYQAPPPPPQPARNSKPNDEHFIYEGDTRPPSPPPPWPNTAADVAEDEEQVNAVAEETEEEEGEGCLPAWHQAHNRGRERQVIALIDQDVLDAMSTDNVISIMQAGFQSLMARRVHH